MVNEFFQFSFAFSLINHICNPPLLNHSHFTNSIHYPIISFFDYFMPFVSLFIIELNFGKP